MGKAREVKVYKRDIENTSKRIFDADNYFGIPNINGADIDVNKWQMETGGVCVGFNYCKSCESKNVDVSEMGVTFFLDDYQFARLWNRPDVYIEKLKKFKFALSPDFSLYTDHPRAVQIFNHYKKHWLSAYWESEGIKVIPTVCWSDSKSFEWCFSGEPKNSIVAVSTKGTQGNEVAKERFLAGYNQMIKRLEPSQVLLFGKDPGGLEGNINFMGYEFNARLR